MSLRVLVVVSLTFALLGGVRPVKAQSLADVARQEAERRKGQTNSGKTYTNKDLPNLQPAIAIAGDAAKTAADAGKNEKPDETATASDDGKSADKADDADKAKDADKTKSGDKPKDESYWAGRQKDLNASLDRDELYADALQSRINALTTDFVNRDDPAQRAVIGDDRQKALDELGRLKLTIDADKKAIADFEEEARRADVPPGWLR